MVALESERLILRDFRPDDFEAFYRTSMDPAYRQFYPEEEVTEAFWQEIFQRVLPPEEEEGRQKYQLAIWTRDEQLIGTCGVRVEVPAHRQASFGCAIARAHWGRGLAYEASRRILEFGFSNLPIERVYAETIGENRAARALAERLGMRLEGEFVHHKFFRGRWWNTVVYAVLREEWGAGVGSRE
jgi:RimJ/RimL family protein N-acetyltransferase